MSKEEEINIIREINILIEKSKNILILSHENPDGDSIGSSLAMYSYINSTNTNVKIYFPNSIPKAYSFLQSSSEINIFNDSKKNDIENADLIIILDVNAYHRIGKIGEILEDLNNNSINKNIILIDHHINPKINATISLIDENSSSTGELVYKVLEANDRFQMNKNIAECIYTAILTDTGGFRHNSTTKTSHILASELLQFGIDITEIYNNIYNQMPINILHILGRAFLSSKLYHEGKLNIMYLTENDLDEFNVIPEELNNFSETTLNVKNVLAGVFISKHKSNNYYKLSFRSRGNIDIRSIALQYNGGGHFNAAGGKEYNLNLPDLIKDIVEKTKLIFK